MKNETNKKATTEITEVAKLSKAEQKGFAPLEGTPFFIDNHGRTVDKDGTSTSGYISAVISLLAKATKLSPELADLAERHTLELKPVGDSYKVSKPAKEESLEELKVKAEKQAKIAAKTAAKVAAKEAASKVSV